MNAEKTDEWMTAPFAWRWYFRFPLGLAVVAAGIAAGIWMAEAKDEWPAWIVGGSIVLYGLAVAWELTLATIAVGLLVALWRWSQGFSVATWVVIGLIFGGWFIGSEIQKVEERMQRKLDALQQQINRLRGDPWA